MTISNEVGVAYTYDDPNESSLRSATFKFHIIEAANDADATNAIFAGLAPTFNGLILDKGSIKLEQDGYNVYKAEVNYIREEDAEGKEKEQPEDPEELVWNWGFSTRGATQKITCAKSSTHHTNEAAAIHETKAINARTTSKGWEVEGTDIIIPRMHIEVVREFDKPVFDFAFINALVTGTGTINETPFMGFAAGELLFEGCEKAVGKLEVTYQFEAAPNKVGVDLGGVVFDADGHSVVDVSWKAVDDANVITMEVHTVHVHRVYDYSAFEDLQVI